MPNAKVRLEKFNIAVLTDSFIKKVVCGIKTNTLRVILDGCCYDYPGTTFNDFTAIIEAESSAKYFNANLRNSLDFDRCEKQNGKWTVVKSVRNGVEV